MQSNFSKMAARRPTIATSAHQFEQIMSSLFAKLNLQPQPGGSTYRVRIDGAIDLNFFPDGEGYLNVVANPMRLPEPVNEVILLRLMALNTYIPLHPKVSVGVIEADRTVQVWTRQPMTQMKDKEATRLLKLMLNAIAHVKTIVEPGMPDQDR